MFDLGSVLFEVWLMQPSCLKDKIAHSLSPRFLMEISKKYSTYKFIEHFPGEPLVVVSHHGCSVKQVLKGNLALASLAFTVWCIVLILAQDWIWHHQQQEQVGPCINKNMSHSDDVLAQGQQKPSCPGRPHLFLLPWAEFDPMSQLIGKDPDSRKDWGQKENGATEDEKVGWYYQHNGQEFERTLGDSEGQGSLAYCSPWGCKEVDVT